MERKEMMKDLDFYPGSITDVTLNHTSATFKTEHGCLLKIYVVSDRILRFRYASEGYFLPDFSYAIDKDYTPALSSLDMEETDEYVTLKTSQLICTVTKENTKIKITNTKGEVIQEDEKGFHWERHPQYNDDIVKITKKISHNENFYGLGDKPTGLNLKGKRLQIWGSDVYGFKKDTDPLYKNIPFYIGLHEHGCYGIFMDNTCRSFFDFGHERNNVSSFWAEGGEMNYYFIFGNHMQSVVRRYTALTGKPELPPLWALGFHQSKWSYYPEANVREIAKNFRDKNIPCDVIHIDIDYMDGFRCFTIDEEKFPDFKKLVSDLENDGFKTVVIIDPGIKVDESYDVFNEGFEKGYFCRRADGNYVRGKVWPGDCFFPDYTNPEVREWWANLFEELIEDLGVAGVWNDMNEPALFEVPSKTFPDDVRHDYDGHPCSHRKAHNVYGMQMARATYHGVKRHRHPKRPFVITRSMYSGTQRYSSSWTGDNIANWEHLWLANVMIQRMAMSGASFVGSDVGGFTERPDTELFIRWVQMAVFHPLFRVHSSGDHGDQEPWSFGPNAEKIVRDQIGFRYKLLPNIYTAFYQYVTHGTPVIRSLVLMHNHDKETHHRMDEFYLGDNFLIIPVQHPGQAQRILYLPQGEWYDFHSNKHHKGNQELVVGITLDQIPVYVRAGAVIPMWPEQQYVGELEFDQIDLFVYYKEGKTSSEFYEDDGDGYLYRQNGYVLKTMNVYGSGFELKIVQHKLGLYEVKYAHYCVHFIGLPFEAKEALIDGEVTELGPDNTLIVREGFEEIILK